MQPIAPRRRKRAKCMNILPACVAEVTLDCPRLTTRLHAMRLFSANLDTKRRVYLEWHGSDVTRVNTALATLGRVHFAIVAITTMPPLVHNLLLFINYLEKGKTINSDYYMALLDRLSPEIKKKRPHMQKKIVLFHSDNASCHKSMKTMARLNELRRLEQ